MVLAHFLFRTEPSLSISLFFFFFLWTASLQDNFELHMAKRNSSNELLSSSTWNIETADTMSKEKMKDWEDWSMIVIIKFLVIEKLSIAIRGSENSRASLHEV